MHWVIICVNSLILCCYTRLTPHFSTDKSGLLLRNKNATQVHWLHWCESNPHGMNDTEMNGCHITKLICCLQWCYWEVMDWRHQIWSSKKYWSYEKYLTPTSNECRLDDHEMKEQHSANPIQLGLLYKFTGSWIVTEGLYLWWQNHCGFWRPGKQWLKAQRLL